MTDTSLTRSSRWLAFRKQIEQLSLLWLILLYIFAGVSYALVTPMLEKHDEEGHYGYVRYLRENWELPPFSSDDASDDAWLIEAKQPPLYYAITAWLTAGLPDLQDADHLLITNPYLDYAAPGQRNDNRNVYLHPPHLTAAFLGARLVSLMFGLSTVLIAYITAMQLFRGTKHEKSYHGIALAVAAVVGFQPKFLYIATAINNDAAVAFFGAALTLLLILRLRQDRVPYFAALMGGLLGLASLTKVSALVFFPLVLFGLFLIHGGFRPALFREGIIILLVAIGIGGWWYIRNAILYQDPLTIGMHTESDIMIRPLLGRLTHDLAGVEHTFWANPARAFISEIWLDRILIWWGRLSLILLMIGLVRVWLSNRAAHVRATHMHTWTTDLRVWSVVLVWPLTFLSLLILYWNQRYRWPFGRLLFPAIVPLGLLLCAGWWTAFPKSWRHVTLTVAASTVLITSLLIPFISILPLYRPWYANADRYPNQPAHIIYRDPTSQTPIVELLGYYIPDTTAPPGAYTQLHLCWRPLATTSDPYAILIHLLPANVTEGQNATDNGPQIWGGRRTYPGLGNQPTDRWELDKVFCDPIKVQISTDAPTPLATVFEVGFINPDTDQRLESITRDGEPLGLPIVKGISVLPSETLEPPSIEAQFNFDNAIGLSIIEKTITQDNRATNLNLSLNWQSLQSITYDATLFVHVVNAEDEILAQIDRQPLDGTYPTSYWVPNQTLTDTVTLSLTEDARAQAVAVKLGLYTWPSLDRLSVQDAQGTHYPNNTVVIHLP